MTDADKCRAIERAMCDVLAAARRAINPLGELMGMERAEPMLRELELAASSIMEATRPYAAKSGLHIGPY